MSIGPWNAADAVAARMDQAKSFQKKAMQDARLRSGITSMTMGGSLKSSGAEKCPGCGSHSFVAASNRRICAYCRTPRTEESP